MRWHRAPLVLAVVVAMLGSTGCMQLGEYAMGSECQAFSEKVQDAVEDVYGIAPQIDKLGAGEAVVWCSFDVVTGKDLPAGDQGRTKALDAVQTLLDDTFDGGVEVALVYGDDDRDFAVLDTSVGPYYQACRTVAKNIERLIVGRYGDDRYSTGVHPPDTDAADPECAFDVIIFSDLELPAGDAARAETALVVQAALPTNTEANLIYDGSRDIITKSSVRTEQAGS